MKTTQPNHPLQAECARAANDWDKLLTPKTAHTPGPWTYSGTAGHESHGQSIVIPEKEGRTVCLVYDGTANASLIAAAPDLLAALQELIEFAEPVLQNHGFGYMGKFKKARAAIAKATG